MGIQVVQIDPGKDRAILEMMCEYMFDQWGSHYVNFFDEISSPSTLADYYNKNRNTRTFVFKNDNGEVIAWYSLTKYGKLDWLSDVFVIPDKRKQGLGGLIVKNAQQRCEKLGLQVDENMIPFYEKYGFKQGQLFIYNGKKGKDFYYRDMLFKHEPDNSYWTMIIVIMCLIGLGLIAVIIIL